MSLVPSRPAATARCGRGLGLAIVFGAAVALVIVLAAFQLSTLQPPTTKPTTTTAPATTQFASTQFTSTQVAWTMTTLLDVIRAADHTYPTTRPLDRPVGFCDLPHASSWTTEDDEPRFAPAGLSLWESRSGS